MRIVLDTNVVLAALFAPGLGAELLDTLLESPECVIVLSDYILDECREHAVRKFKAPPGDVNTALEMIANAAEMADSAPLPKDACPDADDVPVLGTAVAGKAVVLVTGDRKLVDLKSFRGIAIMTPREFFDRLR